MCQNVSSVVPPTSCGGHVSKAELLVDSNWKRRVSIPDETPSHGLLQLLSSVENFAVCRSWCHVWNCAWFQTPACYARCVGFAELDGRKKLTFSLRLRCRQISATKRLLTVQNDGSVWHASHFQTPLQVEQCLHPKFAEARLIDFALPSLPIAQDSALQRDHADANSPRRLTVSAMLEQL